MLNCTFESRLFHNPASGYTVAFYRTKEIKKVPQTAVKSEDGCEVSFTAVGTELPCLEDVEIELEGKWIDSERYGRQYAVASFQIVIPKSREGIIGYLSSGLIRGIGPVTAREIVNVYGTETFRVLNQSPEKLLAIKGITESKLRTIMESYRESSEIRELMAFLSPFKVTPKKAEKIKEHFGLETIHIIRENPYRLCEIKGFGFLTVDPIARASKKFAPNDARRIEAAILYILREAEHEGHLYLESDEIIKSAWELLSEGFLEDAVSRNDIIVAGNEMVKNHMLEADGNAVFLKKNRDAEKRAVYHILRLLSSSVPVYDVERDLEEVQAECGMVLAEQQKEAVRMVFSNPLSIITGGPGKGKTATLKIILKINERIEKKQMILLCAPTGAARKRLSASSGYPALTIHKALYLTGEEEETDEVDEDDYLGEEFIVADEFTMSDMWLSSVLFSRIRSGTRIVLVGDVDQLPSVGAGNVFKELIESKVIPTTVLDVFFRQAKDSRIILNADIINQGKKKLLYGDDFVFCYAEKDGETSEIIREIYKKELEANGNDPDKVQVLSPLKIKTQAGVIALNRVLQDIANCHDMNKSELKTGSGIFRVGDKVMQTKNVEDFSNGDIGRVVEAYSLRDGTKIITVDFDGIQRTYQDEDIMELELAYATSIHKSQGSEYPVVIIPVLMCFYKMLRRDVYYTGITRSREKVYLVGVKRALNIAISNTYAKPRKSLLAKRLIFEANKLNMKQEPIKAA